MNILEEIPVFLGTSEKVKLRPKKNITFTVPIAYKGKTFVKIKYPSVIYAPIDDLKKVGAVSVKLYNGNVYNFNLYPSERVKKASFFSSVFLKVKKFFKTFSFNDPERNEKIRSFKI